MPIRRRLLFALIAGKALDAASTAIVLPLSPTFYESQWLSRQLIEQFGPLLGMAVSVPLAIALVVLVAESGALVDRTAPAEVPDWYADGFRTATYAVGAVWYAVVAVQNVALAM